MREHNISFLKRETPLELLSNLSKHLGGVKIYVKRDDEGGRGGGGNKLRKYDRIIGDAVASNCDTLIIAGHYQSNAARELVGCACQLGMKSIVVCKEMIPSQNDTFKNNGNALLMNIMDAELIPIKKDDDFLEAMREVAKSVKDKGNKPYIIPFGGSNLLGVLGYVDCADEIIKQVKKTNNSFPNYVFLPVGSGGTQAGLIAGFSNKHIKTDVIGVSVLHSEKTIKEITTTLLTEAMKHLNPNFSLKKDVVIDDRFIGKGYGIPTEEGLKAIKLIAKLEGLFLDPVYTGKAMAGLISYIDKGMISKKDSVLFLHTGGMPLIHAYHDKF